MENEKIKPARFDPNSNPYYAHFLKNNSHASAAMARFGEAAWDAALETLREKVQQPGIQSASAAWMIAGTLISTNQRSGAALAAVQPQTDVKEGE